MEASVSVTDVKSYLSYSIKRRGVYQIFSVYDAAFIKFSASMMRRLFQNQISEIIIGVLQSLKTMVSCSDWWFSNGALCG